MILLLFLLHVAASLEEDSAQVTNYSNTKVFQIAPQNDEQKKVLRILDDIAGVKFWSYCSASLATNVMVAPEIEELVRYILIKNNLNYTVLVDDVQKIIDEQKAEELAMSISRPHNQKHNMSWSSYHNLADIYEYLDYLQTAYPEQVTIFKLSENSTEGREIKGVKIGHGKLGIFLEGGMHAREWISPASLTYLATEVLHHSDLLDKFTWYILPVANPDGYDYSRYFSRCWRKTRSKSNGKSDCIGVDPNRNFNVHWNTEGSSKKPCSDIYAGVEPFSEPETRALANFILENKDKIHVYLAVHSYGQLWLLPWGHTKEKPEDFDDLMVVSKAAAAAIKKKHGQRYKVGSTARILYKVPGSSQDWCKAVAGIKYSFAVELRDRGKHAFLLPPVQIIPTSEELFEGVKAAAIVIAETQTQLEFEKSFSNDSTQDL